MSETIELVIVGVHSVGSIKLAEVFEELADFVGVGLGEVGFLGGVGGHVVEFGGEGGGGNHEGVVAGDVGDGEVFLGLVGDLFDVDGACGWFLGGAQGFGEAVAAEGVGWAEVEEVEDGGDDVEHGDGGGVASGFDVGAEREHGNAGLFLVDGAAVEFGAVFVEGFAVVGADE